MYNAVMFDLDGTLLPIDTENFIEKYIQLITNKAKTIMDSNEFMDRFLMSTNKMIEENNPLRTNQEVFMKEFLKGLSVTERRIFDLFDEFYKNEFNQLESMVKEKNDLPRKIINKLNSWGTKVVIATNPVFPRKAIETRMKWAGILDLEFELITSYEIMHFAKPNPEYYLEICEYINESPENCLMVGNDYRYDLAAQKTGMKVFMVTDYLEGHDSNTNSGTKYKLLPDKQGSLKELFNFFDKEYVML
ncbi:HAD family hydrolase [Natranaerofaba carboxydovora]|uniref:HAD family hydrolase n=1 Tax=Natranaerofaba carboxydovora TaxID=2742683 RepID=UPI001F13C4C1|nr:HAD family hydrolase [Natranaerofaba carboxydovora]UMZ74502.1 Haloacid dehalogenase-like hydrolase [Natranaerofaba carboxydovora]